MSSASAYSLEIPSVRQSKDQLSIMPTLQDLSLVGKALAFFLHNKMIKVNYVF
ncbi:hypothetical protein [Alteribacillus sp. YIM 98480]|uniref:hypothetical protein n=1 Tax=Alteribacillus sp. YIM 98480 TaxID=2606599 RepID=UPI00131D9604|nr:hypothetical protein [Alteribacillus sp. YIM 98480]